MLVGLLCVLGVAGGMAAADVVKPLVVRVFFCLRGVDVILVAVRLVWLLCIVFLVVGVFAVPALKQLLSCVGQVL